MSFCAKSWKLVNIVFVFLLAWAYISLVFLVNDVQSRTKCFSIILVCPYLTSEFWTNMFKKTKKQLHVIFGLSIHWNAFFKKQTWAEKICFWREHRSLLILLLTCIGRKYNFCKRPFEILITPLFWVVFLKKEGLRKKV